MMRFPASDDCRVLPLCLFSFLNLCPAHKVLLEIKSLKKLAKANAVGTDQCFLDRTGMEFVPGRRGYFVGTQRVNAVGLTLSPRYPSPKDSEN